MGINGFEGLDQSLSGSIALLNGRFKLGNGLVGHFVSENSMSENVNQRTVARRRTRRASSSLG